MTRQSGSMESKSMLHQAKSITMRHEEKYICSETYLKLLESSIQNFLKPDENQGEDGYEIRSLYFDTVDDRLYDEGVQGIEKRDKYRIRIYNCNADTIKLEKKTSVRNLKKKVTSLLDREYVERTLVGTGGFVTDFDENSLLLEFAYMQNTELLKPKTIVEYNRKAFVSDLGNIRVTLDRNIRTTAMVEEFFSKDVPMMPILPQGMHLLEVKYDGIFPGYLARVLNFENLERTSFSKYVLSAGVIMNNGSIREN